jgi:hypothetical protein
MVSQVVGGEGLQQRSRAVGTHVVGDEESIGAFCNEVSNYRRYHVFFVRDRRDRPDRFAGVWLFANREAHRVSGWIQTTRLVWVSSAGLKLA